MSTDKFDRERAPTKLELLIDFVKVRLGTIAGLALIGGALIAFLGVDVSLPRRAKLAIVTAALLAPGGYMVGNYIVGLLWDPEYIYLIDLDARQTDGALFRFPYDQFTDLRVENGDLCELTPRLYTGKDASLEEMTVQGTWRGTMSDRELLRALNKIEECRGTLEDDAKKGFTLQTQAFTIVRQATRKAVLHIVDTFETGTLPDEGEGITQEVDAALEKFDLKTKLNEIEDTNTDIQPDEVAADTLDLEDDTDQEKAQTDIHA